MKEFLKKHYKKIIIIPIDILVVPALVFFRWLSGQMLLTEKTCPWVLLGGQCISCGGTHFVNDFLSGKFFSAFLDNELLFVIAIYIIIGFVFANLFCLFDFKFAKNALICMFNVFIVGYFALFAFAFLIVRNIPLFIKIAQLLIELI